MRKNLSILLMLLFLPTIFTYSPVYGEPVKFKVAVSIQSLGGIIEDSFGDYVDITYILPEGAEPHSYQVTPDVVKSLADVDIFVFTGHFSFEYTIMDAYKDKPALYLDTKTGYYGGYKLVLLPYPRKNIQEGYNPHGYWLLPDNALMIAAAFRDLLKNLDPTNSELYDKSYNMFKMEIDEIKSMYSKISVKYGLQDANILLGFPAEEYIMYPLNVNMIDVIVRGPGQTITPQELSQAVDILSSSPNKYIVVSDVAISMAVGKILKDIRNQVNAKVIYIDVVGASFTSYKDLVYYNLGRLSGGILAESPGSGGGGNSELNYVLLLFVAFLIIIIIVEAIYIYLISRVY